MPLPLKDLKGGKTGERKEVPLVLQDALPLQGLGGLQEATAGRRPEVA